MRAFLLLFALLGFSKISYAQYGRLEPLGGLDSVYVLRTPKEILKQLATSNDVKKKRQAQLIDAVERQLEYVRGAFLIKRIPEINVRAFTANIENLEKSGVNTSNYLQEYFVYYPKRR